MKASGHTSSLANLFVVYIFMSVRLYFWSSFGVDSLLVFPRHDQKRKSLFSSSPKVWLSLSLFFSFLFSFHWWSVIVFFAFSFFPSSTLQFFPSSFLPFFCSLSLVCSFFSFFRWDFSKFSPSCLPSTTCFLSLAALWIVYLGSSHACGVKTGIRHQIIYCIAT